MELTASRLIDAPADRVWQLQLAHAEWPSHIPNFRSVEPLTPAPFGVGSKVRITQPGLGAVEWTVERFDDAEGARAFAWTGRAKGGRYVGSHRVEATPDGRTRLTLGLQASGAMITVMGPLLKGTMQKAIEAEADCFVQWAADVTVSGQG